MIAKNSPAYCKHLTLEEHHEIQMCLDRGMTFKAIANRIGKDPTTVSKEVKKHLQIKPVASNRSQPTETCPKLLRVPFICNPCQKKPYSYHVIRFAFSTCATANSLTVYVHIASAAFPCVVQPRV